ELAARTGRAAQQRLAKLATGRHRALVTTLVTGDHGELERNTAREQRVQVLGRAAGELVRGLALFLCEHTPADFRVRPASAGRVLHPEGPLSPEFDENQNTRHRSLRFGSLSHGGSSVSLRFSVSLHPRRPLESLRLELDRPVQAVGRRPYGSPRS